MGLLRTTIRSAVLAGAVLASGVQAASAVMPPNDLRTSFTQIFIRDTSAIGVRLIAEKVGQQGALINPETLLTGTFDDSGDPPLVRPLLNHGLLAASTCFDRTAAAANPASPSLYATRTVWYELTQDLVGAPFSQRNLVTVDSAGTNFPSALAVYQGSGPPGVFTPGVSPLPGKELVACDTNLSNGIVPSVVSFVTIPGQRYFLEAGIAPGLSTSGSALKLAMRVLDVTPPVVTVRLNDSNADVDKDAFQYEISTTDASATRAAVSFTQVRTGRPKLVLKPAPIGQPDCNLARMQPRARIGQYCVDKNGEAFAHWHPLSSPSAEFGTVTARFTDPAGNDGTNTLQTKLRDTTPPSILPTPSVRWSRRGRLFLSMRCSAGPGSIQVQYTSNGRKPVNAARPKRYTRHRTMVLKTAFPRVRRQNVFVHVMCFDQSRNMDDLWLFLAR